MSYWHLNWNLTHWSGATFAHFPSPLRLLSQYWSSSQSWSHCCWKRGGALSLFHQSAVSIWIGADAIQKILHQRELIKTNLITGNKGGHRPPSSWSWCSLHRPSWPCSSSPCLPPQTSERGRRRTQKGKHSRVSTHPNVSILKFDNRKSRILSNRELSFKNTLLNVTIGVKGWILAIWVLDLCAGEER